jgi:hypothetical protein
MPPLQTGLRFAKAFFKNSEQEINGIHSSLASLQLRKFNFLGISNLVFWAVSGRRIAMTPAQGLAVQLGTHL